jgi:DNA-directed RNA polymerase subunit K/omega
MSSPYFEKEITYDNNDDDLDINLAKLAEKQNDANVDDEDKINHLADDEDDVDDDINDVDADVDDEDEDEDEDEDDVDDAINDVDDADVDGDGDYEMIGGVKKKVVKVEMEDEYEEDEGEEGEGEGEDKLVKFNQDFRKDYLESMHPEVVIPNSIEVEALCQITRDKQGNIIDEFHTTYPFVSNYIYTKVIAKRARQLQGGATALVPVPENIINPRLIAEMEYNAKQIPFIIKKNLPNGKSEYWRLSDLENIHS